MTTTPPPPINEPDPSALACVGDRVDLCAGRQLLCTSPEWSAGAWGPGTEAAARKALKAQRREENERNRLAKEARRVDSSVHERDSTGTPIRRRLMPVYFLEFCARPHGVSCAPRQCRTGVAHRAFGGLTCAGMPGHVFQET